MDPDAIEDVEIGLLLQGVRQVYGHDFGGYAEASFKRRLRLWLASSGHATFSQAQARLLRDPACFETLLQGITVNVTEMFRDPPFFLALRQKVIPFLQTYPFVKIWHAGCASGEEAYSMAILLQESGLAGRYRIYATDLNEAVLRRAREGIYPLKAMQAATRNYQLSGGTASFADYYTACYDNAMLASSLREHLVFVQHNLVTDSDVGEMNLVLCRNVMIYFKAELKDRCLRLFEHCLQPGGFLCLGMKERLDGRPQGRQYERFAPHLSIYRKPYA
ncbi:CheR family methyltransferase [Duganella violaceipulchra]|uniref:Chemotaxis protein methyltransferase CheR n=1 Tax=Duganella violaceipulchra TaxID=2849652 RepID=A0AA41H788_9BURK|nr:protein-glutamate O-methyltransferase CheR [Duganella violaceicalia]MBV6323347.1 protein-glutamate O-methyltransferase CheR [Duganella violaceicalia]MCP2007702.1 chemotaxis protein methyltransferase CheR [Duganella violaceicalia]